MFGIVWVYNKLMNTPSMIVSPSTILLQPIKAGFMPQIRKKSRFSADVQAMFGHQVGICHHVYATIVVVWHCMGV